jgi:acetylornithine deacetylase/succinyl-diaminopimelate desuccinylase-like protein
MPSDRSFAAITDRIDKQRVKELMVALAQVPSPLTDLLEAEPQLRAFIDTAIEPRLRAMGVTDIVRDRMGNLAASYGQNSSGRALLLVTNAMNQPASTMTNPYGGEVRDGAPYELPGKVVLGKGLSEQKAPLAAILAAMEALTGSGIAVTGRLTFLCCVSGETGRHDAIRHLLEETGLGADMAVLNGTGNRISLGNRGRIDVTITVHGTPCHSSRPAQGCNAVTGAAEVMGRLSEGLQLAASHPDLGTPTWAVNHIRSFPDSTHTIQNRCEITLDRRLIPGEDPDEALAEISRLVRPVDGALDPASGKPWRVEVTKGPFMYPSLVEADSDLLRALCRASETALGVTPPTYYASNAFDQGYLNHIGIPACTYGPGEEKYAHTDLDMASVDRTYDAAKVYAVLAAQQLT